MLHIEEEKMSHEFTKHHVKGAPFEMVFHHFTGADKGGLHDHPFNFTVQVLSGGYIEKRYVKYFKGTSVWLESEIIERKVGDFFTVEADTIHQIIYVPEEGCWTVIRPGKWVKEPGFWKINAEGVFYRQWNETDYKPYKLQL